MSEHTSGCSYIGLCTSSLEATKKFVVDRGITMRIVSVASDTSFRRAYKVFGVPQTILLEPNGVVEKVWVGELAQAEIQEIENLLSAPPRGPFN
jgi:peroxiredoxin